MRSMLAAVLALTPALAAAQDLPPSATEGLEDTVRACFADYNPYAGGPSCLGQAAQGCTAAAGDTTVAIVACIGAAADPCMDQPGGETTLGMGQCLTAETRDWDMLLNAWYDKALQRAGSRDAASGGEAPTAPVLRQAQRAWIAYRDESCRYEALRYQGGSMAGVAQASCLRDMTARQALRLRTLAEGEG